MPRAPLALLLGLTAVALLTAFTVSPIAQDPAYHRFADGRALAGVANFWNVFSNLPFALVGVFGLATCARRHPSVAALPYLVFCVGAIGVALGSGYYHLAPATQTLLWDRLPMTIAFMALFSSILADRVHPRAGQIALWPLLIAGLLSVVYWYWSELAGRGDLRAYAVVQFLPMLLIPVLLLAFPGRGMHLRWLWLTLIFYALAKLAEHFDLQIMQLLMGFSGHSLKHLLAALAVYFAVIAMHRGAHTAQAPEVAVRHGVAH